MLGKLLPFLGNTTKAWFGGVVTFIAVYIIGQFTPIQIDGAQIDAITNIGWALLSGLGIGTAVYAVPNTPLPKDVVDVPVTGPVGNVIGTQKASLFGPVEYVPLIVSDGDYIDPLNGGQIVPLKDRALPEVYAEPEPTELDNTVGLQPVTDTPVPALGQTPEPAAEPVTKQV